MRPNSTYYVIAASTLALILLIVFQVKWLTDSQRFIEEQFDEKVELALCFAVNNTVVEPSANCAGAETCIPMMKGKEGFTKEANNSHVVTESCMPLVQGKDDFTMESTTPFIRSSIDSALEMAFAFYSIDLDYEVEIFEKENFLSFGKFPTYECALNPLEKNDKHVLSITFPEKENYVFGKMKFMFFSSILILLFVTSVFIFANYTLLRQKKMAEINKDFFNNMAHEFRTPLTNITLAGNLLAKKTTDPSHARYLNVVKEESKKLQGQIERVLHLAKLENGEYQLQKENIDPEALLQEVIQGMDIQIKAKKAEISFDSGIGNVLLEGDKFHLSNAFRNLIDNALKYSNTTPQIKIKMKKEKEGVMIQFEDNGIGIGKNDQVGVFEKYQRVNHGDVHDRKGFGLGLAYVKMIIERHQGFIRVFSDLNKGTRFDLFLPMN